MYWRRARIADVATASPDSSSAVTFESSEKSIPTVRSKHVSWRRAHQSGQSSSGRQPPPSRQHVTSGDTHGTDGAGVAPPTNPPRARWVPDGAAGQGPPAGGRGQTRARRQPHAHEHEHAPLPNISSKMVMA